MKAIISNDPETEGALLAHGAYSHVLGHALGHAWIQLADGRIYDVVLDQYFNNIADYATTGGGDVPERTYTRIEAAKTMRSHGHYGPWHEEGLARADAQDLH